MGWLESDGCFGTRRGKASKEGRRTPVSVSEGGAKDTKVEERCRKVLEATGLGKPRGPGATVPRSRRKAGKTNYPHLVLVMVKSS